MTPSNPNTIRIAAAIFNSRFGEIELNIERMLSFIIEAADKGASVICFPEMSITGYGSSESISPYALNLKNPLLQSIQSVSSNKNITVLAGLAEKDDISGKLFISHVVFTPERQTGVYRKLHIAPPEKSIFSEGSNIPLFEANGFTFGIQLCYDAHFPFISTRMAEKGADIIFIPHASPRGTPEEKYQSWLRHIPARAFDNGLFVVVCNQSGDNGANLTFPGIAFVTNPMGYTVSEDISGNEGLLITDLSKKEIDHVRNHRMRYFLPNTRKDIDD